MRFVQLLPSHMTDARTYNMLVSVCIAARDLPMALQAGMMLKNTGRRLDTFLYTNLITGKISFVPLATQHSANKQLDAYSVFECW